MLSNDYIQKLKTELADLQRQQAQLAESYGERHPEMIKIRTAIQAAEAKLQDEIAKVVAVGQERVPGRARAGAQLMAALDAQKTEALSLNRKGIEYGVLQREAESNRQIYESLLQRTKETGISRRAQDHQHPRGGRGGSAARPFRPTPARSAAGASSAASSSPSAWSFFVEYLDNRIKIAAGAASGTSACRSSA